MERLASEYDPKTGHFNFTIDDDVTAEISPEQYVEFISQSMMLVQHVVENYFNGSMKKFIKSQSGHAPPIPIDSTDLVEDVDKWLRHNSTHMEFGA
jgi:hypothetical protein